MSRKVKVPESGGISDDRVERLAWSVARLADAADLSEQSIRRAIREGRLKAQRFGTRIIILDGDARAFLVGRREG